MPNVLTSDEVAQMLPNEWLYDSTKKEVSKEFKKGNFMQAIGFINEIADHAEQLDHHPDIFLHGYNKVLITLSTHSEGGVTVNDINLAKIIDRI
jgi:4a-hydroxytetrahydrobiopterin dehydratase